MRGSKLHGRVSMMFGKIIERLSIKHLRITLQGTDHLVNTQKDLLYSLANNELK